MKKFVFTLQSVLNVKNSLEKQHKAELGAVEARLRAFRAELDRINRRLETARDELRRLMREGVRPLELAAHAVGFKALGEKIEAAERKIEAAEEEKRYIQNKLIEVMRERKMLEKLREKQQGEHSLLQKAEDAAMIDDFLTNKIHAEQGE